jgi:lipopolysaccharide heptosyltransferase II
VDYNVFIAMPYSYTNKIIAWIAGVIDSIGRIFFKKRSLTANSYIHLKILVIKLDQLGDCFLSIPIFEYLKKIFPQANIDIVCQKNSAAVFENNPFIDDILTFNYPRMYRGKAPAKFRDFLSLAWTVRKKEYDISIDLRGEPFAAFLGFLSGAQDRIGFEREEVGGFLYTQPLQYDRDKHETERYKEIIALFGGFVTAWRPCIYLTDSEVAVGKKIIGPFREKGYVVIHPGAGLPYKIWPSERFAELIKRTLQEYEGDVILFGGKEEKAISDSIANIVKDGRLKNMVGQTSLRETYFAISRAEAFLGNDSALVHFAGALDVPTIDLMNVAVHETRWRPLGKKSAVIIGSEKGHRCRYGACPYPCFNMAAITVDEVYKKWRTLIGARVLKNNL